MCDDPWLLSAAEVLDIPVSELERLATNTVVRKVAHGMGYKEPAPVVFIPLDIRVEALNAEDIMQGMIETLWTSWCYGTHGFQITALPDGDGPRPGTPLCEHVKEIAKRLKEIEADRKRDIQAAETEPRENTAYD